MRHVLSCPLCGSPALRPFSLDAASRSRLGGDPPKPPRALHTAQARCRGCGLVMAQPQATEEDLRRYYTERYYEEHPTEAEAHFAENVRDYPLYEIPWMERLWAGFPPPARGSLAEVGCGHGSLLALFQRRGFTVKGAELSPAAAAFCRSKGLDVVERASLDDPADQGRFDVAASFQVIEHVLDPREFVARLVALARPGGAVVITTEDLWIAEYVRAVVRAKLRGEPAPYRTVTEHTFVFQGKHLVRLLEEAGCKGARAVSYARGGARGSLHFRIYKGIYAAVDRALGMGPYLMAVAQKRG